MKKASVLRLLGVTGAIVALTMIVAGAGGASAKAPDKAGKAVISMEQDGKDLFFDGPKTVSAGSVLKIKNDTNPKQVGPHTFSLAIKKDLPKTKNQIKACGKKLKGICGAVVSWHKVNLQTGDVGENPVEVGKQGWDREGSLKRKGDSWVAEKKNATFKRKVTAKPGKVLHFFCAVHPFMQGKIKVTD